jgi:CRISPR-associated endonuclease/helicase Cas3
LTRNFYAETLDPETARLARDWPGKSQPSEHSALLHMLDVGAVARILLTRHLLVDPATDQALACLAALLDLVNISASFQPMLRDGARQNFYHWEHSARLLLKLDDVFESHLSGEKEARRTLIEAMSGHHGGPRPGLEADKLRQQDAEIGEAA